MFYIVYIELGKETYKRSPLFTDYYAGSNLFHYPFIGLSFRSGYNGCSFSVLTFLTQTSDKL